MKKILFVILILSATLSSATERGGESPQAVAKRYQNAFSVRNIEEISACVADSERTMLLSFNLSAAVEISTVLEEVDVSMLNSPTFTADQFPQDTQKRREFVDLVKRTGIKVGGPPKAATAIDPVVHFMSIAGPNPDRTIAELDAYNRRYLGASNPTDQVLQIFPEPDFSNFEISANKNTALMGETPITFLNIDGRWLLSELIVLNFEAE